MLSLVNEIKVLDILLELIPFISVIANTQRYWFVKSISLKDVVLRGGVTRWSHTWIK